MLWLIYDIIYDWRETHQITEAEGTTHMQCLLQAPTPTFACSLTLPIEAAKQVHFHREFIICFCYCFACWFYCVGSHAKHWLPVTFFMTTEKTVSRKLSILIHHCIIRNHSSHGPHLIHSPAFRQDYIKKKKKKQPKIYWIFNSF